MGQYIIDNTDHRFSTKGVWGISTSGTGFMGSNYLYTKNQQKKSSAIWTPNLPAGKYNVYVRYVSGADRSKKVEYTTASGNGITTYYIDQRFNGGQWVKLGRFDVKLPFGNYVMVTSFPTGVTVADSVLFEKLY